MRVVLLSFLTVVSCLAVSAQETSRQALEEFIVIEQKIEALKKEAARLEAMILTPESADLIAAEKENVNVFRLLPREKYDKGFFKVRGGGAYYSFTNRAHSFDAVPQISLEQNHLKVGFYGASYGFLSDLGTVELSKIDADNKNVAFLANYKPPTAMPQARVEQEKARGFEFENIAYKNRLPVVVGNSYVVRAVSFREADVLVAFKIHRQDKDGSLIIFWKMLENFEKPLLAQK